MADRKPFIACGFCSVKSLHVIGYNTINIPDILGVHSNIISAVKFNDLIIKVVESDFYLCALNSFSLVL